MNDTIQTSQGRAVQHGPSKQRRTVFAASFACITGVTIGLYAGIVAKESQSGQRAEWKAPAQTIASHETFDTDPR